MKVFKFGGASVKDAEALRNMAVLVKQYAPGHTVVVVSAMGKTTNALEKILSSWYAQSEELERQIAILYQFHKNMAEQLFPVAHPVFLRIDDYFRQLRQRVSGAPSGNFDFDYDQLVSLGELLSTAIIDEYLRLMGIDSVWMDVRELIITDATWRESAVNWLLTAEAMGRKVKPVFPAGNTQKIILTQGFLGGTADGWTTTLGREGSDYTAAVFSYVLEAEEMIVWKDVDGILNADPKVFPQPVLLPDISYGEAIELTYYGATVIHPKTIKPLQNKNIPLYVRSFLTPGRQGTVIHATSGSESYVSSYIIKGEQMLVSISPKDFSFIAEQNLSEIFAAFAKTGIRINMMQNSAISFTACITDDEQKVEQLFRELSGEFTIKYNTGLQLVTIRHWTPEAIDKLIARKTVLLEQRNRTTIQLVLK